MEQIQHQMEILESLYPSRDELIDVTAYGGSPEFVVGRSAGEIDIARARALYLNGQIEIDAFEQMVGMALERG